MIFPAPIPSRGVRKTRQAKRPRRDIGFRCVVWLGELRSQELATRLISSKMKSGKFCTCSGERANKLPTGSDGLVGTGCDHAGIPAKQQSRKQH